MIGFINVSNRPSKEWSTTKRTAAEYFGTIVDMVDVADHSFEDSSLDSISKLASRIMAGSKPSLVLVEGLEPGVQHMLIGMLQQRNVVCCYTTYYTNGDFKIFKEYGHAPVHIYPGEVPVGE